MKCTQIEESPQGDREEVAGSSFSSDRVGLNKIESTKCDRLSEQCAEVQTIAQPKRLFSSSMCHHPRYSIKKMDRMANRTCIPIQVVERKLSHRIMRLPVCLMILFYVYQQQLLHPGSKQKLPTTIGFAEASLIVGDSAIEIHEVDSINPNESNQPNDNPNEPSIILGTRAQSQTVTNTPTLNAVSSENDHRGRYKAQSMPGPLPPLASSGSTENNGSGKPTGSKESSQTDSRGLDKAIAGKVVDFELTPAGGHNKAKIKKKKKKKEEAEMFKKWAKKKKEEKKAMEKEHKESMKKKKEEGLKKKKKWGHQEKGLKKKGNFKKKKWGKKLKKGTGVKKGKKGKKFLKDKGHKHTGFKTVYHKEEYGGSKKWHDIKRVKQWDEQSKKWKKKWNKEKGKKYKGDHMKKFEKKKKEGKKYNKEKKDKYKKFKKEKFEKGKKKKMEEHSKKKEGGKKEKDMKMKKKKKKP